MLSQSRNKKWTTHARTHARTRARAFNSPFPGLPGWASTRKVKPIWILLKQETVSGSDISWAVCKSAPRSRQITTKLTNSEKNTHLFTKLHHSSSAVKTLLSTHNNNTLYDMIHTENASNFSIFLSSFSIFTVEFYRQISLCHFCCRCYSCLQCFDAVSWAAGRASGL